MAVLMAHTFRTVLGFIGQVTSGFLFLSPAPTFWRICQQKNTGEFHPYSYIASVMNCLFWILYGLPMVHPDSILVISINSAGLAFELTYLSIFFFYTSNREYRWTIIGLLLVELALVGGVAAITLSCFHAHERRSRVVGIICVVFGVIMYFSPLSVMKKVIETKSNEILPFCLSLANFLNGLIWTTYALLQFDIFILIPNALGAAAGACQLILYACYRQPAPPQGDRVILSDEV